MRALMWLLAMWAMGLLVKALARVGRAHRWAKARRDDCEIEWLLAVADTKLRAAGRVRR